jgi:hypothetical protein
LPRAPRPTDPVREARRIAQEISEEVDGRAYALTAVTLAVQERLGEDVVLMPRQTNHSVAGVYTREQPWDGTLHREHLVCYPAPNVEDELGHLDEGQLLPVVLDVAHELGHLLLERGPGRFCTRIGVSPNDLNMIGEIEADWFALCILQMYGFWCARPRT